MVSDRARETRRHQEDKKKEAMKAEKFRSTRERERERERKRKREGARRQEESQFVRKIRNSKTQ